MTPTVQWRTICKVKQPVQTTQHRVHKHLPPIQMPLIIKFSFRTPRDVYSIQLVPLANVTPDIHSLPTRDQVRRLPITLIHSLLFQIYWHEPVHTRRAETWAQAAQSCSAQPVVNMTIGGRIAPTTVIVTIVTVIHMLPTCVGHHQNLLLPLPHSLLFAFIVVVWSIGRWSAETVLETIERKVVYPVQQPVGTPETNNVNLPQHLAKFCQSSILGPEIMTNLGPVATNHRDLQQADNISNNHNAPHRANQIIKIVFLTGITGTVINRDRHDSTKSRIKCILPITLPLPLHSLQALTYSVTLSCSLQKHNLVLLRFLQHNKSLKLMSTRN